MADQQSFRTRTLICVSTLTVMALGACGGGSETFTPIPAGGGVTPPPAPVVVAPTDPCETTPALSTAYASGQIADAEDASALTAEISKDIACASNALNPAKRALFGLDADGNATANTLRAIDWNPTHDAAILDAAGTGAVVLRSNAVFVEDYTVRNEGLGVAAEIGEARTLVLGSNPMRTAYRAGVANAGMDRLLNNATGWMTDRDDLATGELSVVIAQMRQSYYFPDRVAVRSWLDSQYGERVSYNAAATCDGSALAGCLADNPDLLIISQVSEADDIAAVMDTVEAALARGQAVLYMHYDGGLTDLGRALIPALGARYVADNYWRKQSLAGFDGTAGYGDLSKSEADLTALIENLGDDGFSFDLAECDDKSCPDTSAYAAEFLGPVQAVKSRIDAHDRNTTDVFTLDGHKIDKGLVLLADYYRQSATFPMDKNTTPRVEMLRSLFADHTVHVARGIAPVQADLGNFSRSDFAATPRATVPVNLTARRHYSAAGVYAVPGQTVRVTRTDSTSVKTHIRINLLRSGATHEFSDTGYTRPKHLSTSDMPIAPGETLEFTSPHGGPIQVRFDDQDMETAFTFENVGQHAVWRGPEDDADFAAKLDAGEFDWAELITPGFQVHSTLEKMRTTTERENFPSAAQVAAGTQHYLSNLPHVLAGLKGDGIDVVPEIHDFATANGLEVQTLSTVKHMNADQATCGYGCSGNPYDAYWSFNPIGHGDIHELGHGLERSRFLYTGQPGHTGTNPYSYYAKSKYLIATGDAAGLGCQNLPYQRIFETVQDSQKTADPAQFMRDAELTGWSDGAAINFQLMMAAQDLGLLENGYHLLARQHILDREFNVADDNDNAWAAKREGLGFGAFSRAEARALSNNDWNLIALSHALDRDISDWLELWGFELSDAAKLAVADKTKLPTDLYVAQPTDHCTGFPTQKLPADGQQTWPAAKATKPGFDWTDTNEHVCTEGDDH